MRYFTYLALFATTVLALPLNINLGAYSPALVVGDGEISFGGGEAAAAIPAAATPAAATPAAAAGEGKATTESTTAAQLAALGGVTSTEATVPAGGMGKSVAPVNPVFGEAGPAKRSIDVNEKRDDDLVKRQNFAAALQYATAALKTSPEIQLGTGEGGSGVGITQKAGGGVARRGADFDERSERGPTVTLLKIRTLGDTSAKTRRDGESVKRGVEVDEAGNVNMNLDGEIEMVIAEVKA